MPERPEGCFAHRRTVRFFLPCLPCLACILAVWSCSAASLHAWPWTPRKAAFPDPAKVARIDVSITGMPSGTEVRRLSVQKREQIAEALAILQRHRDGWKQVRVTPPAGRVTIIFISTDAKAVWPLCVVRSGEGWISTDINGHVHARDISASDQEKLLKTLGIGSMAVYR
jgi:hypothetical protein